MPPADVLLFEPTSPTEGVDPEDLQLARQLSNGRPVRQEISCFGGSVGSNQGSSIGAQHRDHYGVIQPAWQTGKTRAKGLFGQAEGFIILADIGCQVTGKGNEVWPWQTEARIDPHLQRRPNLTPGTRQVAGRLAREGEVIFGHSRRTVEPACLLESCKPPWRRPLSIERCRD